MMRRALIVFLGVLVFAALPSQAEAGGKHGRHGHGYRHGAYYSFWLAPLVWGPGWYPAYAYPYRYPYRQPASVVVEERVVYVERPPSTAPAENWWYYCESAGDYYPDVASCPERWVKVPPRPESTRSPN